MEMLHAEVMRCGSPTIPRLGKDVDQLPICAQSLLPLRNRSNILVPKATEEPKVGLY